MYHFWFIKTLSALQDTVAKNPNTERKLFDADAISSPTDFSCVCAHWDTAWGASQTQECRETIIEKLHSTSQMSWFDSFFPAASQFSDTALKLQQLSFFQLTMFVCNLSSISVDCICEDR